MVISTILILALWWVLYDLTDSATIRKYFWIGMVVCVLNTLIYNLSQRRIKKILWVRSTWIVMAGAVLVLYYTGFEVAAVFLAAVIFASPFLGATIYEGIVGLTLLITLGKLIL